MVKGKTERALLLAVMAVAVCGQAFGLHQYVPSHHRASKRRVHTRRVLWNPMFRPSRDSLLRQNEEIDRLELPRIQNDAELEDLIASEDLVPIVAGETLRFDPRLDPDRRYCRPWTRDFLDDLSERILQTVPRPDPGQLGGANRTGAEEAAPAQPQRRAGKGRNRVVSPGWHHRGHPTPGHDRGNRCKWMEDYMLPLKNQGLVEPEEERHQWVFHVAVSGRYA